MSLVFAVGDQAILPGTAKRPSLCPQPGKHFDRGLQQEGSDELHDRNFDYHDPFVNDNLFDLYSKLGITEHEMREDVYDNVVDSTIVGSPPIPSCCLLANSCTQEPVHVKGRLKNHLGFWQRIKANRWVISVINDGYALPFIELPPRNVLKNHKSAFEEETFVSEQIMELLAAGCVTETNRSDVHVISPLGVVRNGSKKRLILDLRYVNNYLRIPKFKYEDIRTGRDIFSLGDWFFKFDYKSGYHHVDIFPSHQKFLGFSWTMQGQRKCFVFSVLPFGLASAPFVFTKIQKALVKHWSEQGIRIFTYLDDGAGAGQSYATASAASSIVKGDIAASGFIAHPGNCCWEPTQVGDLLGFTLNLKEGSIHVPPERIARLRERITLVSNGNPTARLAAGLVGTVVSMGLALGPVSRLWTRALYLDILPAEFWSQRITLSPEAAREVEFWKDSFHHCNGRPIWDADPKIDVTSYSDASDTGWGGGGGGYCVNVVGTKVSGSWSATESRESFTWRELRERLVLLSVAEKLSGKTVRHRTDNINVENILKVGSLRPKLHAEAVANYTLCGQHSICLEPEWIPRELNIEADSLSRQVDYDDYMLNPNIFAALDILWGPTLSTGSLPSRHTKSIVSAVAGLTPALRALMHLLSLGQGKIIGCSPHHT